MALSPERREFLREHGVSVGAGVGLVLLLCLAAFFLTRGDSQPVKKVAETLMVKLQPLPPPPPPPPPPKVVETPKMVEQTPVKMPEAKPDKPQDKPPPKADAPPPGPLALDAKGEGPGDDFNLGGRPGGNGLLGGDGGGSRWGWYAVIVQNQVEDAMRRNKKTRNSQARVELRVWADAQGRIERVQLTGSTNDPEVDQALEHEVLEGVMLKQPPPKDMPMPIIVRFTARRPS